MKLRVGIVEDSLENIDTLKYLLDQSSRDIEIVGEAKTLDEARALFAQDLDIAFLDIQLKEGTIFEVLEEWHKSNRDLPPIIFTTAHGSFDYAAKAIRFAALDFLTKPLDLEELTMAMDRVKPKPHMPSGTQLRDEQVGFLLDLLRGNMQAPASIGIILPKGVIEFIDLKQILYFRADESTCKVKTLDGNFYHSTKHLGYYIDLLLGNKEFVQISKGCLVNTDHLKRYNHRDKTLVMKNGESLVASHRFSKVLKKSLVERQGKQVIDDGFLRKLFGR